MISIHETCYNLNREVSIIAGPSSSDLATRIARDLDAELVPVDVRIFTDGESKIKIGKTKKKILYHSTIYISSNRSTSTAGIDDDKEVYRLQSNECLYRYSILGICSPG